MTEDSFAAFLTALAISTATLSSSLIMARVLSAKKQAEEKEQVSQTEIYLLHLAELRSGMNSDDEAVDASHELDTINRLSAARREHLKSEKREELHG